MISAQLQDNLQMFLFGVDDNPSHLRDRDYFQTNYSESERISSDTGAYGKVYKVRTLKNEPRAVKEVELAFKQNYLIQPSGQRTLSEFDKSLLLSFFGCIQECLLKDTFSSPFVAKIYESWIQPSNERGEDLLRVDVDSLAELLSRDSVEIAVTDQQHEALNKIKGHSIFIEMDLYDYNLQTYIIQKKGKIENWITIVRQLDAALEHIHSEGWVHRDIKPDNILVRSVENDDTEQIEVAICDFGIAIQRTVQDQTPSATKYLWNNLGTPPYNSAPEAKINGQTSDICNSAFDMWSLGFVILRLFFPDKREFSAVMTSGKQSTVNRNRLDKWKEKNKIDADAHDMISRCWKEDTTQRAKAGQLFSKAGQLFPNEET